MEVELSGGLARGPGGVEVYGVPEGGPEAAIYLIGGPQGGFGAEREPGRCLGSGADPRVPVTRVLSATALSTDPLLLRSEVVTVTEVVPPRTRLCT